MAKEISKKAHCNQKDKANMPYYFHPKTVASFVTTDDVKVVAYLHDILEDTTLSDIDLIHMGSHENILKAVVLLTHKENEGYDVYISKIKDNALARIVKLANLRNNMDLTQTEHPTIKDFLRLEKNIKNVGRIMIEV